AEQRQLLVEWNNTKVDYPADPCVQQLFEAQVERTPHAVAVVSETEQLTYAQLNRRANQLAHYLRTLGVGPEAPLAVCVDHSLDMVVGLLGILKAGGAYLPLDPKLPKERLVSMLADARTPVVLIQEHLSDALPRQGVHVICIDTGWLDNEG